MSLMACMKRSLGNGSARNGLPQFWRGGEFPCGWCWCWTSWCSVRTSAPAIIGTLTLTACSLTLTLYLWPILRTNLLENRIGWMDQRLTHILSGIDITDLHSPHRSTSRPRLVPSSEWKSRTVLEVLAVVLPLSHLPSLTVRARPSTP